MAGGGSTLLKLAQKVDDIIATLENDEQKVGAEIVRRALSYPLKLIANNAGVNGSVVVQKVRSHTYLRGSISSSIFNFSKKWHQHHNHRMFSMEAEKHKPSVKCQGQLQPHCLLCLFLIRFDRSLTNMIFEEGLLDGSEHSAHTRYILRCWTNKTQPLDTMPQQTITRTS